jgi:hypothetical protein
VLTIEPPEGNSVVTTSQIPATDASDKYDAHTIELLAVKPTEEISR